MDIENALLLEAYKQFIDWMGGIGGYTIDYIMYRNASRFLTFDLKENCSECQEEMLQQGYIDVHLQFAYMIVHELYFAE